MGSSTSQLLAIACFLPQVLSYVDFGTITGPPNFEPTFTIARPHQLPDDVFMRYDLHYSQITAIAPSVTSLGNGTLETFWSMHYHHNPSRTKQGKGLFRRGVFSDDPPQPTCTPCGNSGGGSGNSTDGNASCLVTDYTGVFRSGDFVTSSILGYCFSQGYTGPLQNGASTTSTDLPCCPVCYPPGVNTTATFITGVFSSTTPTISPGGSTNTVTVTATATATVATTNTLTTLSIITVTPSASTTGSPTVSTGFNTIIGCGTAHNGCGTVDGSGTVYLAPFGFPAVTSSGTVSGCAPTIIGCGTLIATTGTFTGTATITACGEGTGSATMIGSGTVWPPGFMDLVSFVSSGTVTGSGRVKGCGVLIGSGTFTVSEPFATTITPGPAPTVNVYISYCPPDPMGQNPLMRLAGNFTGTSPASPPKIMDAARIDGNGSAAYPGLSAQNRYIQDAVLIGSGNFTRLNGTNSTLANPLCHVCPEDSGICCPLYTDCGADGHCPWTALEGSGYARFGVNLVDVRNSSSSLGMQELPIGIGYGLGNARLRAPGLPGLGGTSGKSGGGDGGSVGGATGADDEAGLTEAQKMRKRLAGRSLGNHEALHQHMHRHATGEGHAHAHGR